MREIEIKVRINDMARLLESLDKHKINLGAIKKQHDIVYALPGSQSGNTGVNWLRIRTENDSKIVFTLKQSVIGHLDSLEHEVTVDNGQELEEIIKLLGYELYSVLTKERRKAKIGDIEICVDSVPGLGSFIEAELLLEHDSNHDNAVNRLWSLFNDLGLEKKDEVHEGYDVMERHQRGL